MDIRGKLDREFSRQRAKAVADNDMLLQRYSTVARGYADAEGALVVLSDLAHCESHVFNGRFTKSILFNREKCCNGKIPSIWEQEIFDAIHPDDVEAKMINELLFYHFVRNEPKQLRFNFSLWQKLRMRDARGSYIEVLHRLYYIPSDDGASIRFALCLYGPLVVDMGCKAMTVNNVDGVRHELEPSSGGKILSRQETAVLRLIDRGKSSKEVGEVLNISVHTVSRHRQNINAKLQVHNTIEACRIARSLNII